MQRRRVIGGVEDLSEWVNVSAANYGMGFASNYRGTPRQSFDPHTNLVIFNRRGQARLTNLYLMRESYDRSAAYEVVREVRERLRNLRYWATLIINRQYFLWMVRAMRGRLQR